MRHFILLACLLVAVIANAQYSGPGFYRVHNVFSNSYICINGTHFEKSTNPDAFWPCAKMKTDSAQLTDPGSIIYIPDTIQVGLYSQGVDTYSLTTLLLDVEAAPVMENGLPTYVAHTFYNGFNCYFRDYGNGMTAGGSKRKAESHWWIEPVNEESMDYSYFGLQPIINDTANTDGWYWATMCCDFPILIPKGSGVEGAYTIREITMGCDSIFYAEPVKVYGQGEVVPAAMPILFKCASPYASGNKVIPVGDIANHRTMPITNDLLMGNYFSAFTNHADFIDYDVTKTYIPEQATVGAPQYMALSVDANGYPTFMSTDSTAYMAANSAWLDITSVTITEQKSPVKSIRLGEAPELPEDPQEPEEPEEPIVGDIDGDGYANVTDVNILVHAILYSELTEYVPAYDVNQDGEVNVEDVTALIKMVLEA